MSGPTLYQRPVELLQNLIRFDTTNPPGSEKECVLYIRDELAALGIESTLLPKDPDRPNLIARLKGRGDAPPLLLQGHVDVVTTENQDWEHPPFAAEIHDGWMWGRGTLDMKGPVTLFLSAFMRAKAENIDLPGDVILCILADEEADGSYGAKFLAEEHAGQFEGVKYALGEFGGFPLALAGKTFYPIMIGEKQIASTVVRIKGPAGHGSGIHRDAAAARLGKFLATLNEKRLPVHITPGVRLMIETIAEGLGGVQGMLIRGLLNPALTDTILGLMGEQGRVFEPLLHNTVNATMFQGSSKINVIPGEIEVRLDGRLLPGMKPDILIRELKALAGDDLSYDVYKYDVGPGEPDMGLFDTLGGILTEQNPDAIPLPLVLPAVTDGRHFATLGIQTYGFTPLNLPTDFNFNSLVHAANERVPVDAIEWGSEQVFKALQRFGEGR